MKVTISARIGTLRAIAPLGEDKIKPRTAGTLASNKVPLKLESTKALPKTSKAPEATVAFLRSRAPKAAKVTSQRALFFRIFGKTAVFVLVMIMMVITPANVASAMSTLSKAANRAVIMIGEKENRSSLRFVFGFDFFSETSCFVFFGVSQPYEVSNCNHSDYYERLSGDKGDKCSFGQDGCQDKERLIG
jgi:hypothetical protein